jgi:hypothetical protein
VAAATESVAVNGTAVEVDRNMMAQRMQALGSGEFGLGEGQFGQPGQGIGGGVCQVSTTVFRAAFWGGFPIVERYAHGYVVSWYEPPRGLDATIYTPSVDFRFRNDTEHFLLVKPEVDADAGRVTFTLYGTKVDRTVEMEGPEISNLTKPDPPVYEEDASLAEGVIKQVDWAKDGQDVVITRHILYGDGTVVDQNFVSKYRPWQAVYKYGPGTSLPDAGAAAEGG